jgi:hypothetical protein
MSSIIKVDKSFVWNADRGYLHPLKSKTSIQRQVNRVRERKCRVEEQKCQGGTDNVAYPPGLEDIEYHFDTGRNNLFYSHVNGKGMMGWRQTQAHLSFAKN